MTHIKIDEQSKFFLIVILMSMLLFNNGIYLFVPLAILYIILYYLQQPFMPAVFSLVAIQHFVNITAGVWLANYLEKDINYRSLSSATAIIASAIGLIFLLAPVFIENSPKSIIKFVFQLPLIHSCWLIRSLDTLT